MNEADNSSVRFFFVTFDFNIRYERFCSLAIFVCLSISGGGYVTLRCLYIASQSALRRVLTFLCPHRKK